MQGNRKVLNLSVSVTITSCPGWPAGNLASRSGIAGLILEAGWERDRIGAKTRRKTSAAIGNGQSLAYGLELHLRGNSKVLGRIAILFFDEGGVLGWRG